MATEDSTGSFSTVNFEEGWPILQEEAVNKLIDILEGNHQQQFSSTDYMRLYTVAYNICVSNPAGPDQQKLYDQYQKTFEDYISTRVVPSLRGKKDEILLKELVKRWNNHKTMTRWLSRFLHFLDRYFISKRRLPTLQGTSHLAFYKLVYGEMNDQIRDAVISMIHREREGGEIDQDLVKNVIDIYVEMAEDSMKYYEKDFEKAMLEDTARYYSQKASSWIETDSYQNYMLKVEESLKQEKARVNSYLRYRSIYKLTEVTLISHSESVNIIMARIITFDEGWGFMEGGITKLINNLEGKPETPISSEDYMMLYTTIFQLCSQKPPHDYSQQLYEKYRQTFQDYIISTVLPSPREKHDESMLRELVKRCLNHKIMVRWMVRFFHYVDRYFTARRSLPALNEVGLTCFRDLVYQELRDIVRNAVLSLIDQEREGEQIDRALLKNVVDIFIEIGMGQMDYYENDFEVAMLNNTVAYYSRKAADWILQESCQDYMLKAEECLNLEKDMVSCYLHSSSQSKLIEKVQQEFFTVHATHLPEKDHSGCHGLITADKICRGCICFSPIYLKT
ncbi:hypothetical protein ACH5RR_031135 [Cinchona calisaya]|uniref:Cullin N-terminal domain-containing protein n=1 Tax=Cinchona calisaya TaxID=153742 RepID=A0ABD2YEB1_9GENT